MDNVDVNAKKIWDYMLLRQKLEKADCILVLGSRDIRPVEWGIELYKQDYAPYIMFSGGLGKISKLTFKKTEAETAAELAIKAGISKDKILIEKESTNTSENASFSKKLLERMNMDFKSFIIVQKPYVERRIYATFKKQWPDKEFIVNSPPIVYENYATKNISKEEFINVMLGDLQRIQVYAEQGFQIEQEIPEDVWNAYLELVDLGFNKYLIREST